MPENAQKGVIKSFPISRVYQAHIPTCPSGYWLFGFASKKYHPLYDLDAKDGMHWDLKPGITQHIYTGELSCFRNMWRIYSRKRKQGKIIINYIRTKANQEEQK